MKSINDSLIPRTPSRVMGSVNAPLIKDVFERWKKYSLVISIPLPAAASPYGKKHTARFYLLLMQHCF
ncbi:hypothetical protein [Treponema vincentii]|uniref:hypothetical protein n=1 Tax=Treponema vincentii TaxID=69710 RepID=UPI0012DC08C9|nr:hypothetical protein [Treponema vincentii]